MPAERYYIDTPLAGSVTLEGDEFHHLSRVMRTKTGESVELVNGKGDLAIATVASLEKKSATLQIQSVTHDDQKYPVVILAQALPRQNHLEWIIEKGTELGTAAFWLFPGEWSEKRDFNEERLKNLTISAMKQCGRLYLPEIVKRPPLSAWEPFAGSLYFGDPETKKPLSKPLKEPVVFFIGPEKGFSPKEKEILQTHLSAIGCRLSANTLRTETAAIVALSLLLNWVGKSL